MQSYTDAFDLTYCDSDGNQEQVVQVLAEQEGEVTLAVRTVWADPIVTVKFDLRVPLVTPVPFTGDEGLRGDKIRLPWSRTSRFCHPLLVSSFAEGIAKDLGSRSAASRRQALTRHRYAKPEDWEFEWINWYGRINRMTHDVIQTLMESRQAPTTSFVHFQFRRGIANLITPTEDQNRPTSWAENGTNNCSGLPVTDECLILRQMFEVRLGYPDVPNNDQVYEGLKMRYVEFVDSFCDVCWTSKNHTGREVGRIFQEDAKSFITGRPMPRLLRGLNALAQIANPARVWREDRSCAGWLVFDNPIAPPLTPKGVRLPAPFQKRVTTLMTAIIDLPGFNTFEADAQDLADFGDRVKEGEEISLDGLLVTRSGQTRLLAKVVVSEQETAEEFLPHKGELQELPGFQFEEDPSEIDTLQDGTQVFTSLYRYSWDRSVRCGYDKVKCLCGGIKGVTRPVQQMFAEIGGETVQIDMVISERTALSKGARDLFLYPLLAHAGLTEIDPAWTMEELVAMTEEGLEEKGLPQDGRFPIYANRRAYVYSGKELDDETANSLMSMNVMLQTRTKKVLLGWGIVGLLPYVRAQETEHRQSSASQGMSLSTHSRILGGVPPALCEDTQYRVKATTQFFYDYRLLASITDTSTQGTEDDW
jgi:hypothetical protein